MIQVTCVIPKSLYKGILASINLIHLHFIRTGGQAMRKVKKKNYLKKKKKWTALFTIDHENPEPGKKKCHLESYSHAFLLISFICNSNIINMYQSQVRTWA